MCVFPRTLMLAACLSIGLSGAASVQNRDRDGDERRPPGTPVPDALLMEAFQGTPEPACVARAATFRDRGMAEADSISRLNEGRGGYSVGLMSTNCNEATGQPQCIVKLRACLGACWTASVARQIHPDPAKTACDAACNLPFQNCCYTNAMNMYKNLYDEEVKRCPTIKDPVPAPSRPQQGRVGEPVWNTGLTVPPRGTAAFLRYIVGQATLAHPTIGDASRALRGNDFLLAKDSSGRVSMTTTSGTRALPPVKDLRARKLPILNSSDVLARALDALKVASSEMPSVKGEVNGGGDFAQNRTTDRRYVAAGANGIAVNDSPTTLVASSELWSLKGEVNGGGDFVYNFAIPDMDPSWEHNGIQVPGGEFAMLGTTVAVDVAANGVSAVAVLEGKVRARELTTNQAREVNAGEVAVVLPGFGVAPVQPMAPELRAYLEAVAGAGASRPTRTSEPLSRILAGGEEWRMRIRAGGPLVLDARVPWNIPAGATNALELSVDGQIVTWPLSNKGPDVTYADGRTFPYLDAKTGHWSVLYSPDFSANNGPGGGDYRVVSRPGQAYRYAWEIPRPASGSESVELRIRNALPNVPMEVRLVSGAEAR